MRHVFSATSILSRSVIRVGQRVSNSNIIVDGVMFTAATNLVSALHEFQKVASLRVRLWVDAICVNQRDLQERQQQVQLMKYIYSRAARVIGWLAPDEYYATHGLALLDFLICVAAPTDEYLEVLNELDKLSERKATGEPLDYQEIRNSVPSLAKMNDVSLHNTVNKGLIGLRYLMRRSYWSRIWIALEFILADGFSFMCGSEIRDLDDKMLHQSAFTLAELHGRTRRLSSSTTMNLLSTIDLSQYLQLAHLRALYHDKLLKNDTEMFVLLLETMGDMQATDPRDKLFALLGIGNFNITPDYSVSASKTYLDFARRAIEERCFRVIDQVGVGLELKPSGYESKDGLDELPSWAPDWSRLRCTRLLPIIPSEIDAFSHPLTEINIEINASVLSWPGVILDTISEVAKMLQKPTNMN